MFPPQWWRIILIKRNQVWVLFAFFYPWIRKNSATKSNFPPPNDCILMRSNPVWVLFAFVNPGIPSGISVSGTSLFLESLLHTVNESSGVKRGKPIHLGIPAPHWPLPKLTGWVSGNSRPQVNKGEGEMVNALNSEERRNLPKKMNQATGELDGNPKLPK